MKGLLIDENLPLPTALPTSLPVTHSKLLGSQPSDTAIWDHALANDLVIVTKDADFVQRINLQGPPPRVCICALATCVARCSSPGCTSYGPALKAPVQRTSW